ncbi:MAG: nucleotide exchange factor GrpE [Gammaproteobacteria bacterium]|jgi:molecular chaperone GrpE
MTEEKKTSEDAAEDTGDSGAENAPEAPAADAAAPSSDDRVRALEAELTELKDKSLRALADAENTRRRTQRELSDARKYAASGVIKDLLNVSDNLTRALEACPAALRERDEQVKNLVIGVEMVAKDLLDAFEKHGVRKIEPLGEPFDHDFHQAMYEVENSGKPSGTVVEMLQPGFVMHDRLLRPAMVAVAKGDPDNPPEGHERVDTTA